MKKDTEEEQEDFKFKELTALDLKEMIQGEDIFFKDENKKDLKDLEDFLNEEDED